MPKPMSKIELYNAEVEAYNAIIDAEQSRRGSAAGWLLEEVVMPRWAVAVGVLVLVLALVT